MDRARAAARRRGAVRGRGATWSAVLVADGERLSDPRCGAWTAPVFDVGTAAAPGGRLGLWVALGDDRPAGTVVEQLPLPLPAGATRPGAGPQPCG
ncbi:hypothetical protein ACIQF6_35190 [Kitasatospora sp. NPDC092948]|uniref:hypothetical protein n=1 Tax=Kitasatospora sp. NPDC092948 TaxID=3364088 RepID=UPI00380DBBAB